jgi:hypothetical protein
MPAKGILKLIASRAKDQVLAVAGFDFRWPHRLTLAFDQRVKNIGQVVGHYVNDVRPGIALALFIQRPLNGIKQPCAEVALFVTMLSRQSPLSICSMVSVSSED